MQLKLDVKTLVVGIVLGLVIAFALGVDGVRGVSPRGTAGGASKADFGIAIEKDGLALVQTSDGSFFVVDPDKAMAVRVLEATSLKAEPGNSRDSKGRPLGMGSSGGYQKTSDQSKTR